MPITAVPWPVWAISLSMVIDSRPSRTRLGWHCEPSIAARGVGVKERELGSL